MKRSDALSRALALQDCRNLARCAERAARVALTGDTNQRRTQLIEEARRRLGAVADALERLA
jgi:hypothetical protein